MVQSGKSRSAEACGHEADRHAHLEPGHQFLVSGGRGRSRAQDPHLRGALRSRGRRRERRARDPGARRRGDRRLPGRRPDRAGIHAHDRCHRPAAPRHSHPWLHARLAYRVRAIQRPRVSLRAAGSGDPRGRMAGVSARAGEPRVRLPRRERQSAEGVPDEFLRVCCAHGEGAERALRPRYLGRGA